MNIYYISFAQPDILALFLRYCLYKLESMDFDGNFTKLFSHCFIVTQTLLILPFYKGKRFASVLKPNFVI